MVKYIDCCWTIAGVFARVRIGLAFRRPIVCGLYVRISETLIFLENSKDVMERAGFDRDAIMRSHVGTIIQFYISRWLTNRLIRSGRKIIEKLRKDYDFAGK